MRCIDFNFKLHYPSVLQYVGTCWTSCPSLIYRSSSSREDPLSTEVEPTSHVDHRDTPGPGSLIGPLRPPATRITSGPEPLRVAVVEVYRFRSLVTRFAARDVTLRYRQTALGVVWVVLQPLLAAGAFTLVFGKVAKLPSDGVNYLSFALSGLVLWTAFSGTIAKSGASLVINAPLIAKVYFPRLALPLSTLGGVLFDAAIGMALLSVVMVFTGTSTSWTVVLLVPLLLGVLALSLGCGLIASALSARYRDVVFIVTAGLQVLLYVSPVGYGLSAVPDELRTIYAVNPLSGYLEGARWALFSTTPPSPGVMMYSLLMSLFALLFGGWLFNRRQVGFADVI